MNVHQKVALFFIRIALGWLFFYAGIAKLLKPGWSAAFYLKDAHTLPGFYHALMNPSILPIINNVVTWGFVLLGISLIVGSFVRLSSYLGAVLMLLLYFPVLQFPYPNANSFIVDEHIVYAAVLIFLGTIRAGRYYGFDEAWARYPWYARLRSIFG